MTKQAEVQCLTSKKARNECVNSVENESNVYSDRYFAKYYNNKDLLVDLSCCLDALQKWNEYCLCCLKIVNCNGNGSLNFHKAFCQAERYKCKHPIVNNSTVVRKFSLASVFKYGEEIVTHFIKPRNESRLPHRKGPRIALAKLLHFMTEELHGEYNTCACVISGLCVQCVLTFM